MQKEHRKERNILAMINISDDFITNYHSLNAPKCCCEKGLSSQTFHGWWANREQILYERNAFSPKRKLDITYPMFELSELLCFDDCIVTNTHSYTLPVFIRNQNETCKADGIENSKSS